MHHAMLRVCGAVANLYLDDAAVFSVKALQDLSLQAYELISEACGVTISEKKTQMSVPGKAIKLLGVMYEYSTCGDKLTIDVGDDAKEKATEAAENAIHELNNKSLQIKTLQRVLGRSNWVLAARSSRLGAQLARPLYEWTVPERFDKLVKDRAARRQLHRRLEVLQKFIWLYKPIVITKHLVSDKRVWMFTDASTNGGPTGEPMLGGMIICCNGQIKAFSLAHANREERIEILEARAVLVAMKTFEEEIKDKTVIFSVDNSPAAYSLVNCASRNTALARLAENTSITATRAGAKVFWDFVKSQFNPADAFTRSAYYAEALKTWNPTMVEP